SRDRLSLDASARQGANLLRLRASRPRQGMVGRRRGARDMSAPLASDDATERQQKAANPDNSVWVSASAGTGKTTVLTDRVLRLLLQGTPPSRLLCLTFTKAAAAEMMTRVVKRLGAWATMGDAALSIDLDK